MNFLGQVLLSAAGSAALVGMVIWLFKELIKTRLVASVEHEFSIKLEKLKSEIREKQEQIDTVRRVAASGLINNRQAIDQRKIIAIDAIIESMLDSKKLLWASAVMSRLKVEEVVKSLDHESMRKFIAGVSDNLESLVKLDPSIAVKAATAEPYLTVGAWALYKAYVGILYYDALRLLTLKHGFDPVKFTTDEELRKTVVKALPWSEKYVEQHGSSGYHFLLEGIESALMDELRAIVDGRKDDLLAVERAMKILGAVNQLESRLPNLQGAQSSA